MSKLKKIQKKYGMLNESYVWEREEGKPLPTLADIQAKYNAKPVNEQGDLGKPSLVNKDDLRDIDIDGSLREIMKTWKNVVMINRTSGKKDVTLLQAALQLAIEKSSRLYGEISTAYQIVLNDDPGSEITDDTLEDNPIEI